MVSILNFLRLGARRPVLFHIDIFIVDVGLFILVGGKHIPFHAHFANDIIIFVHLGNEPVQMRQPSPRPIGLISGVANGGRIALWPRGERIIDIFVDF